MEQDKVEKVEEGGVCGKTTEFVLAKLHQTVSFTKHSLNPPMEATPRERV